MLDASLDEGILEEHGKPRFSHLLTSPVITVTVGTSKTFYIHHTLLTGESERLTNSLKGGFKEASEKTIELLEEDAELFGFFVTYLYRDLSVFSSTITHESQYVTLARLYALGERLLASNFKSLCLWRFTQSLRGNVKISDWVIGDLLRIASTEITERLEEDPMRAHIFWYGAGRISTLQKFDVFRQLLWEHPDLGRNLCLWINTVQPEGSAKPTAQLKDKFAPESEYSLEQNP